MEDIFKALADETRRKIIDKLRKKDGLTLSELEEEFEMSRFGVMKHLKILETASLVVVRRSGRFKYHYLNIVPLQEILDRWIEPIVRKPLAKGLLALKSDLEGDETMTNNNERPDFVLQTYIKSSPDLVWDALTNPDKSEIYHFSAARVEADLKVGGRFDHVAPDGSLMFGSEIIAIDPPKLIKFTFMPGWDKETPLTEVTYEIEQVAEFTKLTVVHHAVPEMLDGVREGWSKIVSSLKSYLETGKPLIIPMSQAS